MRQPAPTARPRAPFWHSQNAASASAGSASICCNAGRSREQATGWQLIPHALAIAPGTLDAMTKPMLTLLDSILASTARTVRAVVLIVAVAVATCSAPGLDHLLPITPSTTTSTSTPAPVR
jgi:hypothetical protein